MFVPRRSGPIFALVHLLKCKTEEHCTTKRKCEPSYANSKGANSATIIDGTLYSGLLPYTIALFAGRGLRLEIVLTFSL